MPLRVWPGAGPLALLTLGAALVLAQPAGAAKTPPKRGTFAGSLGVALPTGAHGEVRAVRRDSREVAVARTVGRSGRFSLRLAPGAYTVIASVIRKRGRAAPVRTRIGVSLKAGQRRTKTSMKARRRKARRSARAAYVQELGQVTPGRIAVEIPPFTGATGELSVMNKGMADMLITDVVGDTDCDAAVLEVEHRDAIIKELEFQKSPYVDPSTRVIRNFIVGDVVVRGTLKSVRAPLPVGAKLAYDVQIVDKRSGETVGQLKGSIPAPQIFEGEQRLAKALNEELCKLTDVYAVTLDVKGIGRFATHDGSGTLTSTLRARRSSRSDRIWRDSGALAWSNLASSSKLPRCVMSDFVPGASPWSVTITDAGNELLKVVWGTADVGAAANSTATIDCPPEGPGDPDPPPVPGMPLTSLLSTGPTTFTVPYAGGTQAITGEVSDGGDGFFNGGTIVVKPAGVARIG